MANAIEGGQVSMVEQIEAEPAELLNSGDLNGSIAAASQRVARAPMALEPRLFLAQALCLDANWDRAERVLSQARDLDKPGQHRELIQTLETLLQGERQRAQVWGGRELPCFLDPLGSEERTHLWRIECYRTGRWAELAESCLTWERPKLRVAWRGKEYDGIRDLDDLLAGVLEVLTLNGKYVWLPWQLVKSLRIIPPARPIKPMDLRWSIAVLDLGAIDPEFFCFLPNTYFQTDAAPRASLRLGRDTELEVHAEADLLMGCGRKLLELGDAVEVDLASLDGLQLVARGEQ